MKRILVALALFAAPLGAQADSALLARIARLEAVIGDIQRRCAEQLGDSVRPAELPNREYPVMYRQCQLGSAADVAYTQTLPSFQTQLNGLQASFTGWATRLAAVETKVSQVPQPAQNVVIPGDLKSSLESIGAVFNNQGTLAAFKFAEYGAPEGPYYGYAGVNDGAWRQLSGIRSKIGAEWPNVDTNSGFPVLMHAMERDRGLSWDYQPPLRAEDPNPHPYKTFLMYFGGFRRGVGPRALNDVGPYMDFGTFEVGRGIRYFVRRPGSATPDTESILQMDAGGLAIRVGDGLRRVRMRPDGTLYVTDPIIEDQ